MIVEPNNVSSFYVSPESFLICQQIILVSTIVQSSLLGGGGGAVLSTQWRSNKKQGQYLYNLIGMQDTMPNGAEWSQKQLLLLLQNAIFIVLNAGGGG